MSERVRLGVAAAVAAVGIGVSGAASAYNAAAPSCSTVSSSVVKAALGGSPGTPGSSTSTNSFYGYKATDLSCTYSTTINVTYSTPATVGDYNKALSTLKNVAGAKLVSGIGNGAFSGTGTNNVCSSKCVSVKTQNLWVLVTGKSFFEISGSKVTAAQEEVLAKKMVPLV